LVYIFSWKNWFQLHFLGQKFALFFNLLNTMRLFCFIHMIFSTYICIYAQNWWRKLWQRKISFSFPYAKIEKRMRVQVRAHVRIVSFTKPRSIQSAPAWYCKGKLIFLFFILCIFILSGVFLSPFVLLSRCLSFFSFRDIKWSCRLFCMHCLTNFKGKLYITRCMWTTARGVSPFIYSLFEFKSNLFQVSTWNPSACLLNGEVSFSEHVDTLAPKVQGLR